MGKLSTVLLFCIGVNYIRVCNGAATQCSSCGNRGISSELPNIMMCDGSLPDELRVARYECVMNESAPKVREIREQCQKSLFSSLSKVEFLNEMCLSTEAKAKFKQCLSKELEPLREAPPLYDRESESFYRNSDRARVPSYRASHQQNSGQSQTPKPPSNAGVPSYSTYVKCFVKTNLVKPSKDDKDGGDGSTVVKE